MAPLSFLRLTVAAGLLSASFAYAAPPTLSIDPKDEHSITPKDDSTVVDIRSKRGIGRTTILAKDGEWPKRVILRLHLKGLESFEISNGAKTLKTFVSSQKNAPPHPGPLKVKLVPAEGAAAKIPLQGYFEIEVPADLLKGKPESLKLHWIDFYRG